MVVLAALVMLLAMSAAWIIQLSLIAVNGHICFQEENRAVLYLEITAVSLIGVFALVAFVIQYRRLGEKRAGEDRRAGPHAPGPGRVTRSRDRDS